MYDGQRSRKRPRHDVKERTFYRFVFLSGFYARALAAMYGPRYRLSLSSWKVLGVLGVHAPMSATEAGRRTSLQPDKVTRAVDSLLKQGFVLRKQDPVDKRRVILSLSAKGERAFQDVDRVRFAIESEMLALLSGVELRVLRRALDKIARRCDELFEGGTNSWQDILALHEDASTGETPVQAARHASSAVAK